ncbi:MAG TPA: peptide chain release factor N(5)-glutamine methyltransferase [Planctomycetes bacterium]|nr:peptide chain release factor N(5)-glutamine methyltransferase [Planctomycetota bacterium]
MSATVRDVLLLSSEYLASRGVPHARREAENLLAHVLGTGRIGVYLLFERELTDDERSTLRDMVRRRGRREPLAYILGCADFMGRRFRVTTDTLAPRPETELLAEIAVRKLPRDAPARFADVGTGCGALAAAILAERPAASALATDLSASALAVARENFLALGLAERVELVQCDLLPSNAADLDLIAANLPYVSEADYEKLEPEVKAEPRNALVAGLLGTELIEALIARSTSFLRPAGWLLLEFGYNQSERILGALHRSGFVDVFIEEDLAGMPRVAGGSLPQ